MSTTLILAASHRDAQRYASLVGLRSSQWRCPVNADGLRGLRPEKIVELPSWQSRGNRHAIEPRLRNGIVPIERVVLTEDELAELERAANAQPPAPEHTKQRVGEQLDIYDVLGGRPDRGAMRKSVEAAAKAKAAKKTAAKKAAAPKPAPTDDFFGV